MDLALQKPPLSPRVLFATPEAAPVTKTGGLGDVSAALPAALRALGADVTVLLPGYPAVLRGVRCEALATFSELGQELRLLSGVLAGSGVPLFVLDCPPLYAREGGPYQDPAGRDWPDNALRFGVLSRVAARLGTARSPLAAWRADVVHCNDWPTALAPVWLKFEAGPKAASLMTIHNLAFQGLFDAGDRERLGLPPQSWSMDGAEFHGRLSFLKGGIACASALSTVSPTYAREIQTAALGCGLDGLLRHRSASLSGILNGIDEATWNPATDPHLARVYDAASLERKPANKLALQRRMALELDEEVPLFGQVGRLTEQKGVDLLLDAAPDLVRLGQLVVLGAGEARFEAALRGLAQAHPGRIAVHVGFDEALAHQIEAGADLFLMPSRYEPCGLNQMYSQRYGTPPVARATGGLADTIEDGVTGFLFEQAERQALGGALERALLAYRDPAAWSALQRAGMARDFSWSAAARRYAALYSRLATLAAA